MFSRFFLTVLIIIIGSIAALIGIVTMLSPSYPLAILIILLSGFIGNAMFSLFYFSFSRRQGLETERHVFRRGFKKGIVVGLLISIILSIQLIFGIL